MFFKIIGSDLIEAKLNTYFCFTLNFFITSLNFEKDSIANSFFVLSKKTVSSIGYAFNSTAHITG